MRTSGLKFRCLGLRDYAPVWEAMKSFTLARQGDTVDEIWLLQHNPVFTLGQAGKLEHVLDPRRIPVLETDRGGQVTYHGPGQLTAYLLLDLRRRKMSFRQLLDLIEGSIIKALGTWSISAVTRKGAPGVYVDGGKIAALGLRVRKGCCYHGLSLNVDMDLAPFSYINPCGFPGLKVTQMRNCLPGHGDDLFDEAQRRLTDELARGLSAP